MQKAEAFPFAERVLAKSAREFRGESQPAHRLILHLLDSAATAQTIWNTVLSGNQRRYLDGFEQFIIYAAGMHDIGKCSPHWQRSTLQLDRVDERTLDQHIDDDARQHDINGGTFFSYDSALKTSEVRESLSVIVRGHHGHFKEDAAGREADSASMKRRREWSEDQRHLEDIVMEVLEVTPDSFYDFTELSHDMTMAVTGIVMLADWLASDSSFIEGGRQDATDYTAYYVDALARAEHAVLDKQLASPAWRDDISWNTVYPDFTPNPLQESLATALPNGVEGLLLISAPPGAGKSKAALYAAAKAGATVGAGGITFCLPTRATTDAMYSSVVEIVPSIFRSDASVAIKHSSASVSPATRALKEAIERQFVADDESQRTNVYDDEDSAPDLFMNEYLADKKPLSGMTHLSVSTIDQLITATVRQKNNPLRWLSASGRVVILDEVHDFDSYTFSIICRFVEWCGAYGVPVIAMSATLSGEGQRQLALAYRKSKVHGKAYAALRENLRTSIPDAGLPSPSWLHIPTHRDMQFQTVASDTYIPYRMRVHPASKFTPVVQQLASEHLSQDATVLIVCHTVDQAIATFESVRHLADSALLHSRMPALYKDEVSARVAKVVGKGGDRKPFILVATQLIQQSFDFDFDVLVTPACPLPDLLQRIGRVYRHEQGEKRAEAYWDNPRVEYVVEQRIWNRSSMGSDQSNASLTPYLDGNAWSVLGSVETVRRVLEKRPDGLWDAKGDLLDAFEEYVGVCADVESGKVSTPHLLKAFLESKAQTAALQHEGNEVVVPHATGISDWHMLTNKDRSEAATRKLEGSDTYLVLSQARGRLFFDPECTIPFTSTADAQLVAQWAVNLGKSWKRHMAEGFITETGTFPRLPQHILCVDSEKTADYATLEPIYGVRRHSEPKERYLWL